MATEYPPISRIHVVGYSANDTDYPILNLVADPRVAGYRVPEDFSICPDKRYPNHIFTGAQPISGDQRVRHTWEILPSPWVPFTRYDDDLGPIQGRRRSVKNEGQVASLGSDKRTTYEAREGSAIVYTEIEESWSIKTDKDGNSLFPVRVRDFYDASRGAVEERRQLFVPTGEEVGTLENNNGIITQTSYEPYNEFLSYKIVQTYAVNGPQLIGKTTDNDGQLVTVTTQRKASDNYVAPQPTATRTVEVSREDAESLIERVIDTPEIFKANTFSIERPDPIPQKFRVAVPIQSSQEIVEGTAEVPTLEEGEISKSEEQRNKFIKRVSSTSRDQTVLPQTLTGKTTNNERQEVTVTETLQEGDTNESPTATTTIESEALGDGNYVITKTEIPEIFSAKVIAKEAVDPAPAKFRIAAPTVTEEETVEGNISEPELNVGDISKSEQQVNKFVKRLRSTFRNLLSLPKTLTQKATNEQKQLLTVTETLKVGDTTEVPTATKTVESEALGDGTYLVRTVSAPKVFEGRLLAKEANDPVPAKFRIAVPAKTEEKTIVGEVEEPTLESGEISKSEEQITEFTKRKRLVSRSVLDLPKTLDQKTTDDDGQVVTVKETLQEGDTSETPTARKIVESEAMGDGTYLVRTREIPDIFDQKSVSVQKVDITPQKFRADIEQREESQIIEGTSVNPQLGGEEESRSEQRVDKFRIRRTIRKKAVIDPPITLTQKQTNDQKQIVNVTETYQIGDTNELPSATKEIQSESLGDNRYIVRKIEIPNVFQGLSRTVEKPDVVPIEFRSQVLNEIVEENIQGSVPEEIQLSENEFSRSEQQVDNFVKRIRSATRPLEISAELIGEQIDSDGIKLSITKTLSREEQTITPSELISGSVESIGDGLYLKTQIEKESVFDEKLISNQKPDVFPPAFRASIPTVTTQNIVTKEDVSEQDVELDASDLEKSIQRVTAFTARQTTVTRDAEIIPELIGQEYEPDVNIVVRYNEKIVESGTSIGNEATIVDPLSEDYDLTRTYDLESIESELNSIIFEFPTRTSLSLPPILKKVNVVFESGSEDGEYSSSAQQSSLAQFGTQSISESGSASCSASVSPNFAVTIENVYANNIPTTSYIFFLKYPVTIGDILARVGAEQWPVFKPQSHTLVAFGESRTKRVSASASFSTSIVQRTENTTTFSILRSAGSGSSGSNQSVIATSMIPACLHNNISIGVIGSSDASGTASISFNWPELAVVDRTDSASASGSISQGSLSATSPPDIPRSGLYLIDSRVELYKYGFARVYAEVLNASVLD